MIKNALGLAAVLFASSVAPAPAQTPLDSLLNGRLVFYGNYCGPGHRGRHPTPIDSLDAACRRHDACVVDFQLPSCACNARLAREAAAVARSHRAPARERQAADFTARGAQVLPCQ